MPKILSKSIMKEKVLNLLKTSYAKYGFKKEELEGLAEIIGKNLADDATDEDVSNAVSGAEAWASMMQKVATRTASDVEKKYKQKVEPEPTHDPKRDEPSALEKEMAEIKSQLAAMAAERNNERMRSMLMSDERLKNIPSAFVGKYKLDAVENLDAVAMQIETDFNALKAEMLKNGIVANMPNMGNDLGGEKPTDDELKNIANSII